MKKNYKFNSLLQKTFFKAFLGASLVIAAQADVTAQTYCVPATTSTTYYINNFSTTGAVTNISNMNSGLSAGGYGDFTATQIVTSAPGQSFTFTGNFASGTYGVKIWVDWNGDGTFNATNEQMFVTSSYISSFTGTITVPSSGTVGVTRMRVGANWLNSTGPANACENFTYGEYEDYKVILAPDNNAAAGNLLTPNSDPFCSNATKNITVSVMNRGGNALNSVNVGWSVDGVTQTPVAVTTPMAAYGDSVIVALGDVFFANNNSKTIKFWTAQPNNVADSKTSDDTTTKVVTAVLTGVDVSITPGDTTICEGQSITLDAGVHPLNPIYIWENGTLTRTRTVSTSGMYFVKVQNTMGCFDRDTIVVTVHPDPLLNSIAVIDNNDGSFTLNAIGAQNISSFTWSFGDGSNDVNDSGSPVQLIHEYSNCGEYTVTLTVRNDCGEVTSTRLIKIDCPTGIDNISALQKEISVFPNPSTSKVTISNKANIKMKALSVVNLMGQNVYRNDKVNAEQIEINITGFAAGIYNVRIDTDRGMITKKLEVIK